MFSLVQIPAPSIQDNQFFMTRTRGGLAATKSALTLRNSLTSRYVGLQISCAPSLYILCCNF